MRFRKELSLWRGLVFESLKRLISRANYENEGVTLTRVNWFNDDVGVICRGSGNDGGKGGGDYLSIADAAAI